MYDLNEEAKRLLDSAIAELNNEGGNYSAAEYLLSLEPDGFWSTSIKNTREVRSLQFSLEHKWSRIDIERDTIAAIRRAIGKAFASD